MAVLKLIGAKRFMNKRACANVIELGGVTDDIQDENLIKALLDWRRIDADNKSYPMFEECEDTDNEDMDMDMDVSGDEQEEDPAPTIEEPEGEKPATEVDEDTKAEVAPEVEPEVEKPKPKPPAKKKAARKSAPRSRKRPS